LRAIPKGIARFLVSKFSGREEKFMESVYVGWLSILPPIIAIGLALITKEVISSLMIGILSGTLIYTVAVAATPSLTP